MNAQQTRTLAMSLLLTTAYAQTALGSAAERAATGVTGHHIEAAAAPVSEAKVSDSKLSSAATSYKQWTPEAIATAESAYQRQVQEGRQVGTALNNLAVLAVQTGKDAEAKSYFEQALSTNDSMKGSYAYNYSKFLESKDKAAAVQWARVAAQTTPNSDTANAHLASLLTETNPTEVLPLASSLLDKGHTDLANKLAMQSLSSGTRPVDEKKAWLILVCERVAREAGVSETVARDVAAELEALQADPDVGIGSTQLRNVLSKPPTGAGVSWWRQQGDTLPGNTDSGAVAMRKLLLVLGEAHATKDRGAAEAYYEAALELAPHGADPDAFLRLVELYADDPAKIEALMRNYEFALFSEKSDAYQNKDWPLVYRLHIALGMTYASLGVWRSTSTYQNAVFQLSNAMTAATKANAEPGNKTRLALPPVAVDKLAQGYRTRGDANLAAKAQVDGAVALMDVGKTADSKVVFATISKESVAQLDSTARADYERLHTALPP